MIAVGLEPESAIADEIAGRLRDLGDGDLDGAIDQAVRRARPLADDAERTSLGRAVRARLGGLDRLEPLLHDPTVDEILIGDGEIWVERDGAVGRVGAIDAVTTTRIVERVLAPLGRRVDRTSPIVDARLPDGSRVCAVVEPVAVDGPVLSIRRFAAEVRHLDEFLPSDPRRAGRVRDRCIELIERRCNVLAVGATSTGKTSLLASLLALADRADRVVVLEDTSEMPCRAPHLVRLEARPATIDGPPPITMEQLVRTALRLRPDRLVVGEVRGDEVVGLLQALNTGHDGSFSTCHANGSLDALSRLESLVLRAAPNWPLEAVRHTIARSIDAVVHVARRGARREIVDVTEVVLPDPAAPSTPLEVVSLLGDRPLTRGRT